MKGVVLFLMTDKSEIDEKSQLAARLFLKANDELGLIFTYQPKRHTHDTFTLCTNTS